MFRRRRYALTGKCQWPGCKVPVRSNSTYCTPHAKLAWKKANPEKVRDARAARRAREKQAYSEPISREKVWKRDRGICGVCHRKADPSNWHLDHIIPLVKGGSHTYGNVQVTHPLCNKKKGAKIITKSKAA